MSSFLRPVVLESCQLTTLRERRRSSIHSLSAIPRLFSSASPPDESALSDDPPPSDALCVNPGARSSELDPPSLSPLSDAHVSDYFTSTVPRHNSAAPMLYTFGPSSPSETIVYSGPSSHKVSSGNLRSESPVSLYPLEHLRWRLASGFLAYFLCGWGDGGK